MYLAREMTELSLDEIGSAFREDATGVRDAVDLIDELAWNGPFSTPAARTRGC